MTRAISTTLVRTRILEIEVLDIGLSIFIWATWVDKQASEGPGYETIYRQDASLFVGKIFTSDFIFMLLN